ncbi:MAG: helix-turn-helix transcriptional regulator [Clostridia bacterium]|nr:helix-turn-helix transcriptional regulator [Clostridia bacterium]
MDASKLGNFIADQRKLLGMTQADLGNKLMVTDKAVSKWERGLGFPDINTLESLAEALHVSVNELMRAEKNVTEVTNEEAVAEALHNTIEVADKQIKNAEKRSIMVIFGAVAVAVLGMLVIDNMTLLELGMATAFVYLPLVCIFSSLVLFIWALHQRKKGRAYKRTITWAAIMAGIVVLFALVLFVAGMISTPVAS